MRNNPNERQDVTFSIRSGALADLEQVCELMRQRDGVEPDIGLSVSEGIGMAAQLRRGDLASALCRPRSVAHRNGPDDSRPASLHRP